MMDQVTLSQLRDWPPGKVAAQPIEVLAALADSLAEMKSFVADAEARLNAGLDVRFGDRARQLRAADGKDSGRVRLGDGLFVIVADVAKRIDWDQDKLAADRRPHPPVRRRPGRIRPDHLRGQRARVWRVAFADPPAVRAGPHRQVGQAAVRDRGAPGNGGRLMAAPNPETVGTVAKFDRERGFATGFRIITADERLRERRGIKGGAAGHQRHRQDHAAVDPARRAKRCSSTSRPAISPSRAGPATRSGHAPGRSAGDFAVFIGGPNPALRDDQPYSQAHYRRRLRALRRSSACSTATRRSSSTRSRLPDASASNGARASREAISEKTGKPDIRGAYGLHGREMIGWLTQLQHTRNKNVWFVGILDEKFDDFNRRYFAPQIDGAKTGSELPGIVDEVITMAEIPADDGVVVPRLRLPHAQPMGYPAKDRSGRLDMIEEPHLGRLMAKIRGPVKPAHERMEFGRPASRDADTPQPSQA